MHIHKIIKNRANKPRIDMGNCYFCDEPVYASEGQIIKHVKIGVNGKFDEYPTHKKCRKGKKI